MSTDSPSRTRRRGRARCGSSPGGHTSNSGRELSTGYCHTIQSDRGPVSPSGHPVEAVAELGRGQLEDLVGAAERHAADEQHPAGRQAVLRPGSSGARVRGHARTSASGDNSVRPIGSRAEAARSPLGNAGQRGFRAQRRVRRTTAVCALRNRCDVISGSLTPLPYRRDVGVPCRRRTRRGRCGGRVADAASFTTARSHPPVDGEDRMKRSLVAIVAAGALLFAACGGDNSSSSSATTAGGGAPPRPRRRGNDGAAGGAATTASGRRGGRRRQPPGARRSAAPAPVRRPRGDPIKLGRHRHQRARHRLHVDHGHDEGVLRLRERQRRHQRPPDPVHRRDRAGRSRSRSRRWPRSSSSRTRCSASSATPASSTAASTRTTTPSRACS